MCGSKKKIQGCVQRTALLCEVSMVAVVTEKVMMQMMKHLAKDTTL